MARKPVYARMSRRELIERMNNGDKQAAELYGHLLDMDEAKFLEENRIYESKHDMAKQREFISPIMNVIASLNQDAPDYHDLLREQFEILDKFQKEHSEAIEVITNLEQGAEGTQLYKFVHRLTREDFLQYVGLDLSDSDWEAFEADRVSFFRGLYIADCVTLYEAKKTRYRTKQKAREDANIVESMPRALAIPTLADYRNTMNFYPQGKAYMIQFDKTAIESMKFENGKLYMPVLDKPGVQPRLKALSKIELQNVTTKKGIEKIDLPFLVLIYSIYLNKYEENGFEITETETISIYIPDLLEVMGLKRNASQEDIQNNILSKFDDFHPVRGVIAYNEGGKRREGYLQVLNVEEYNAATNRITISSPYIKRVLKEIYEAAKRKDKKGEVKMSASGKPLLKPMHSYLALPTLEKNKKARRAVTNVFIILALIEEAGNNTANIKAGKIIERNVQLAESLNGRKVKDANITLKRVFKKTWELLRTQTKLTEKYINIQLPDENNPADIPTMATLDKVFRFTHDGMRS